MKHFATAEFEFSVLAKRSGIDNTIPDNILPNVYHLVNNLLDPLREEFGLPILVTSGYRCPRLNRIVNGVKDSQHLTGNAADITASYRSGRIRLLNACLGALIETNHDFDQLIYYDEDLTGPAFLHVSLALPGDKNRRQVLHKRSFIKY